MEVPAPKQKDMSRALHIQKLNEAWLACPFCDALWKRPKLTEGQSATCSHCHSVIMRNRPNGTQRTLAMMIASLILYFLAITFPFLDLERSGLSNEMSVIDAVTVLWSEDLKSLSIIVGLFVLVFPLVRIMLLIYISLIVSLNKPTYSREALLFRFTEKIDKWTMSEIFVIGVMVSLVEIMQLARVSLLPGFWAMAGMILLLALGSTALCRDTIWNNIRTVDATAPRKVKTRFPRDR